MDQRKQQHILKNLEGLVKNTNYDVLAVSCLNEGIINEKALKIIEAKHNRHEELFMKITRRSNKAYDDLMNICKIAHFVEAYNILEAIHEKQYDNTMRSLQKSHHSAPNRSYVLEEYIKELPPLKNINLVKVEKSSEIHEHHLLKTYQMKSRNRGVLFLVNNIEFKEKGNINVEKTRHGAQFDKHYMISLFREFGFKIYYYENLTLNDFQNYLQNLLQSNILYETECLVFSLLTHGGENNEVTFNDSKTMDVFAILFKFNNRNCPALKSKPKIFIFPFCRGNSPDIGVDSIILPGRIQTESASSNAEDPCCQDMIICYGTVDGFEAIRQVHKGSWYITELYKVFAQDGHNKDLETLLYRVNKEVMNLRPDPNDRVNPNIVQTPCVVKWDFNKILFFNPGFREND